MEINVTKSYLDLARSVIDTKLYGKYVQGDSSDAIFALMSCTYVYSYTALTAFSSSHLYKIWETENNKLKVKFAEYNTFEELMAGPMREIKTALKELATQLGIEPLHKGKASLWRELNELLKGYRDYFIHPNPKMFHQHLEKTGNQQWGFPSRVAAEIIGYFHESTQGHVPYWVKNSGLKARGFEINNINESGQAVSRFTLVN